MSPDYPSAPDSPHTSSDPARAVPFSQTLEVRDRCLCLGVQRAARVLARRFDAALRPAGLNNGQFSLLMALNRPEPPRLGAVADLLGLDRTTLTAALKPLDARGLVRVSRDADDRRARRAQLTEAGEAALARAYPLWVAAHDAVDDALAAQGGDGAGLRAGLDLVATLGV